jgi:hypothetical protein
MSIAATLFVLIASIALLLVPRRLALLPLLVGAFYMTLGQGVLIGPFHFTVIRILVGVGVIRILVRREQPRNGLIGNTLDRLMIVWAAIAIGVSPFHDIPNATLINHLGMVYNTLGIYFLIRCFCQSEEEVKRAVLMVAFLLVPLALEMLNEQLTNRNLFATFGGVPDSPELRNGRLRSQGPFRHSILAGTVGATCAPLMIGIWREYTLIAKIGLVSCLLIVVTSASSGPLMSLIFSALGIFLWYWRHLTRQMRIAAVIAYILLEIVMLAPAYYLIARIDLAGGSTGWHRAKLIESAIEYIGEWWLAGTDHTRHWMPYGVTWSENHADITNHYIQMGVIGGLPLMFLFISIIWYGFRYVGESLKLRVQAAVKDQFFVWCLGASLFAHAASCISVSYFDQSIFFLYFDLAMIASLRGSTMVRAGEAQSLKKEKQMLKL